VSQYLQIHCNCPSQDIADSIANTLVDMELAACVNILPEISSVYRWQQKIERATEYQLQIKTTAKHYQRLEEQILKLHPYDVPEIIAIAITHGHQPYLDWIEQNTASL